MFPGSYQKKPYYGSWLSGKKKMFCVFKWDFPLSQAVTDHWDLDPFPVDAASFNSISPFCMLVSVCLLSYNLHLSVGILFSLYIMKTA